MHRSISFKLMLGTMLIILAPMAIIYLLTSHNIAGLSRDSFDRAAMGELKQAGNVILTVFEEAKLNTSMLAAHPLMQRLGELTTSHVDKTTPTPAGPEPDDAFGRELDKVFKLMRETHPTYLQVYAGNSAGKFLLNSAKADKTQPAGYDPRRRPWWPRSLATPENAVITKAYKGADGFPMVSVCKAIRDAKGEVLGVAAMDITLTTLTDLIRDIRIGRTGYVMLVQDDGVILSNPKDASHNFTNIKETGGGGLAELFASGHKTSQVRVGDKDYQAAIYSAPQLNWKLIGLIEEGELMEPVSRSVGQIAVVVVLGLAAIGLGIRYFAGRMVISPLKSVGAFLHDITRGEYKSLTSGRKDEIGGIVEALNTMSATLKANMTEIESRTAEAQQKATACELATREAEEARLRADTARAEGMLDAAGQLELAAEELGAAVSALSGHSQGIRQGSRVQRERIATTAAAMEEMNATVLEVAKNASGASEQSHDARDKAQQGAQVVGGSLAAMRETQQKALALRDSMHQLDTRAQAIGNIMTTIKDIADQTNLLALNAAIEAARAGESGRGFAVVADEVRKLAEKTMFATKEVGDAIVSIQAMAKQNVGAVDEAAKDLEQAAGLVGQSGSALDEIVSSSDSSAASIQSIATAAEEQSASSEEINRSMDEINTIAEKTDQHVTDSLKALGDLEDLAQALAQLIARLKDQAGDAETDQSAVSAGLAALPQSTRPQLRA